MEPESLNSSKIEIYKNLHEKMSYCVGMAIFIGPEPSTPYSVLNNGTASFLELPIGKFIITNHHVWETFKQKREEIPGLRLAVTGKGYVQPVDISTAELVDSDEGLDLAILRFEANDLIEMIGNRFYVPKRWPLDVGNEGDDVAVVGYPGKRREPTPSYLRLESCFLGLRVLSVSDRKYMLGFITSKPLIANSSSRPLPVFDQFSWGGMSGSMVYRLDHENNKFYVVGFLHAAGEGLQASFFASRADVIKADGTIRRGT